MAHKLWVELDAEAEKEAQCCAMYLILVLVPFRIPECIRPVVSAKYLLVSSYVPVAVFRGAIYDMLICCEW